jgi:hypothetical protein
MLGQAPSEFYICFINKIFFVIVYHFKLCIPIRISLTLTTLCVLLEVSDFLNLFTWKSGSQIATEINNVESNSLAATAPSFGNETFLAPFSELRSATISFVMSVRPSA